MPALRKPHRVAFLLPDVTIEGSDGALEHEAALVLWLACIEVCQRHPQLAVYDAESTPLVPQDGHFSPQAATIGATPTDPFYATARRDEVVWLELNVPKVNLVRLHALGRDGKRSSYDAPGKNLGDQIEQVIGAWLAARALAPLPKRFPSASYEELVAVTRPIAPVLVEQARAWALPGQTWVFEASDGSDAPADPDDAPVLEVADAPSTSVRVRPIIARPAAKRVPTGPLKLAALRVLSLALREDLDAAILEADPDQPQALFATFRATVTRGRDYALLRRIIAVAPCWARPYAELVDADSPDDASDKPVAPSELETVAGAGIAALCRPQHLDVIERVAELLDDSGLVDEGVRMLERSLTSHDHDSHAHRALLHRLRETDREGAWLAQAYRSARRHGCTQDPNAYWYPDQILTDVALADALLGVGRLDEAIALRANRLEGREAIWPRHARILASWRKSVRFVARSYAREGAFRGEPERAVEGYGRSEPTEDVDVAIFLDALVATGREAEVALAWSQFGLGRGHTGPVARLAAARGLLAAGEWRRGMEELWRVELSEPGRDEHVALARCGLLLSSAPLAAAEDAIGERVAIGATSLARRMARDVADFVPGATHSAVITRALGKLAKVEMDLGTLGGFASDTHGKSAIDALFAELGARDSSDELARSDRLVNRWLEVAFTDASDEDPAALVQAAAYTAANALGRYLAMTTAPASPLAGALRTVAGEALALVRMHREALTDRDARAVLGAIEPLLRRVDRWIGSAWLGTVERSLGIDERSRGDVAGFAERSPTIAARILGPEEAAVLAASVARLHRERPANWANAVVAQATPLALHTGYLGADQWADAISAQLAAKEIDLDDAIDELHTTAYLVEGISAGPAVHAARILLEAGRGPAALSVLAAGLGAAREDWRDRQLPTLASAWAKLNLDVPFDVATAATKMHDALQDNDAPRAERIGRWMVAFDPRSAEAHRTLGLALAQQGKAAEALEHLERATPEHALSLLADTLHGAGKAAEATAVLDYASHWSTQLEADASVPAPDNGWRARRQELERARFRHASENTVAVTARALAAATATLAATTGLVDRDAMIARVAALQIREQAYFARDPVPRLGERMTREAFHQELRARGGIVLGADAPPPPPFKDRIVVPGSPIARVSDYVALLRDLAALDPREAIAQFSLDEASYLAVATAWAAALAADPSLAQTIAAALAKA